MNRLILICLIFLASLSLSAQTYTVSGGMGNPYAYDKDLTGMSVEKVYLLNTLTGATITASSSAASVTFYMYRYSYNDKVPVPAVDSPGLGGVTNYTISNLEDGRGYWMEEVSPGKLTVKDAVWVIDYSAHRPTISSVSPVEDAADRCELLKLIINKADDDLLFYAPKSTQLARKISREYVISYENQKWDDNLHTFVNTVSERTFTNLGTEVLLGEEDALPIPLKNTVFKLSGDQFAKHFGNGQSVSSSPYTAVAVQAKLVSVKTDRDNPNENDEIEDVGVIGGSAPVNMKFFGHGNEAVSYYTWMIYNSKDMNNPVARYTDKDIEYEFNLNGNYTVVLEVVDKTSTCIDTVFQSIAVSDFWLDAPNFFSPGNSHGVNTEFKVVYRSVVDFKCTIFNRWGVKLYEWRDPAQGWDGRHNGRYVAPGVYYYVIEAKGGDGKKHTKGGSISILRSK